MSRKFRPDSRTAHKPAPKQQGYWLWGMHPVTLALGNEERQLSRILITKNSEARVKPLIKAGHPAPEIVEPSIIDKLLPAGAIHQGVAALAKSLPEVDLDDILRMDTSKPLVLLDQVTDPHNVGAILRSAAAFGAAAVIVTKHNAPEETGTLAKSASGALEVVPLVTVSNLVQAMETIKKAGYWIAGMDGTAKQTIAEAKLSGKTALVMGAEGSGMRRLTMEHCDLLVKLPMSGAIESLNVSNAAAIALYELYRSA